MTSYMTPTVCNAEQVGDFLASILDSSDPSVSFQAAEGLLLLTRTLSSGGNTGGLRAVAGVASSWGALAVAAMLQLWDRQLSFAGRPQLMAVITEHLDCLQVCSKTLTLFVKVQGYADCLSCNYIRLTMLVQQARATFLKLGCVSQPLHCQHSLYHGFLVRVATPSTVMSGWPVSESASDSGL